MIDIKFKEYLTDKITIEELIHFFDTFNYTDEEIKSNGIVYTPKYIADYIVNELNPTIDETIIEPSVGHGIFIISLLEFILDKYKLSYETLSQYLYNNVFFQDLQKQNIDELLLILSLFFKKHNFDLDITKLKYTIGDTLYSTINTFDLSMGNPPYVRITNINEDYLTQLRLDYKSMEKGNVDLYYAFLEYVSTNKRSGFIVPNSWLYNSSAKALRKILKNDLVSIIDFKQQMIFETAQTYTSILITDKSKQLEYINYKEKIDDDYTEIKKQSLNDNRWEFYSSDITISLNYIDFLGPTATNADKIFITDKINNTDTMTFYKISKIKTQEDYNTQALNIVVPYNSDFVIKKENELHKETLQYLIDNKPLLVKRDKGKIDKYDAWYAFARRQGLHNFSKYTDKNVIIIPGMISKDFKFFATAVMDLDVPFLFSSGFLLVVDKDETEKILNFLNNKFKIYYINNGKVWKGKDENSAYYSVTMKQLKQLIKLDEKPIKKGIFEDKSSFLF